MRGALARTVTCLVVLAACVQGSEGSPPPDPRSPSPAEAATDAGEDSPIRHVVFIIKENRTFDHYFGRYPGAEGATHGTTHDGRRIPLRPAPDVQPHDITHGFSSALYAITAGR